MSDGIDIETANATDQMQRTIVHIADQAVAIKQIEYGDAAIGTMYAAFDLYRRSELSVEGSLAMMRQAVEIMAKDIHEEKIAPRYV